MKASNSVKPIPSQELSLFAVLATLSPAMLVSREKKLNRIYKEFAKEARKYMHLVACKPGCADCCIDVGNIDTTTLEGLIILKYLKTLPSRQLKYLKEILKKNAEEKIYSRRLRCPFLNEKSICSIYKIRPFSCRRLFSVQTCGETGPVIPRQLWEAGEKTLRKIYELDEDGYCGHISHILELLNNPSCYKKYVSGKLASEEIKNIIEKYNLIVIRETLRKEKILANQNFCSL